MKLIGLGILTGIILIASCGTPANAHKNTDPTTTTTVPETTTTTTTVPVPETTVPVPETTTPEPETTVPEPTVPATEPEPVGTPETTAPPTTEVGVGTPISWEPVAAGDALPATGPTAGDVFWTALVVLLFGGGLWIASKRW